MYSCSSQPRPKVRSASIRSAEDWGARKATEGAAKHHGRLSEAPVDATPAPSAPVSQGEIVKGYEYEKGQYVLIEPSELANLRVPSKHVIEISQFVELSELTPEWVRKPYFVTPLDTTQAEAFAVVRKAL